MHGSSAISSFFRAIVALAAILVVPPVLHAQQGGSPGSAYRRALGAEEIGRAGVATVMTPSAGDLFGNAAALARLEGRSFALSYSTLPFFQRAYNAGFAAPFGPIGIGVGLANFRQGNYGLRTVDERSLGTGSSNNFSLIGGVGLGVGPGSVGMRVRYLRFDLSGIEGSTSGLTFDISGTLRFRERLGFGIELDNVAGFMSGPDGAARDYEEILPWHSRLAASYLFPLEERTTSLRDNPSGVSRTVSLPPRTYVLAAGEVKLNQDDDPVVGIAVEVAPIADESRPGLRAGFDTNGDISGGFFFDAPITNDWFDRLQFAISTRRDYEAGDVTFHLTVTPFF